MTFMALSHKKNKEGEPAEKYILIYNGGKTYEFSYFVRDKWTKFLKKEIPVLFGRQSWRIFLEERFSNCSIFCIPENFQERNFYEDYFRMEKN